MGFSQAPAGVSGEGKVPPLPTPTPPRKATGPTSGRKQKPVGTDSSRKGQPLPTRSALGEPPHAERGRVSLKRPAPTHPFTHPDQPNGTAGRGLWHPTRNKRQLEPGSAAPVPAVLWGSGVGRENLVPGEGKGPPAPARRRGATGRNPGQRGPLPRFLEETGAGLCTGAAGREIGLGSGGRGRPARPGEESALGRRGGVVPAERWRMRAWRGSWS